MLTDILRRPILMARVIAKRIKEIPSKGFPKILIRRDDGFDQKYGVDTFPLVYAVSTPSLNLAHGHRYEASPEKTVRWVLENCGMNYGDTVFIDVGCGKGRVLILAAERPFQRILGIEYSPELAQICRNNLAKVGLQDRCEVLVCDAADFEFPQGNLLAFFYNPFDSVLLERIFKNLASTKGYIRLAYHGTGKDVIESSPAARSLASGEDATLYEVVST
ncbi:MAG TPA: class I SAM-dependent methyltransferase [Candidatus Dormibacteraeota bacterium]|nr:class I SAM-dependent methyltransferase [Candidatus Dormibacteraeota bacterium]